MNSDEEKIRKELDNLFEKAETIEDWNNIRFLIDESIDEGYNVRDYINKYNSFVQEFCSKSI